jgi:hypothetical protein
MSPLDEHRCNQEDDHCRKTKNEIEEKEEMQKKKKKKGDTYRAIAPPWGLTFCAGIFNSRAQ